MSTLDWQEEGRDWPNRAHSRFVEAGGVDWHVQIMGEGPVLLLVHGAGASTHTWRDLAPVLARDFTVVAPDMPDNGFSRQRRRRRPTILAMGERLAALLHALDLTPRYACGHSAGAAILTRMALDGRLAPKRLASLNGALLPFPGAAGSLFPALAKVLFLNPVAPRFFAWRARDRRAVVRLIESTGSTIDERGITLYQRLFRSQVHVEATLSMMANWDLDTLARDLPRLACPLSLFDAGNDKAVSPRVARQVAERVMDATHFTFAGLGHLMHEEDPERIAGTIRSAWRETV
ncbi:alpha/beta fold hydrolase BchO [Pararhizobium mangrovi]|uniref:Alpha/beta fold hydrolase n=1 Tax=Pararhizobium mangrovi TaxID=2590452 RepID=A0A506U8D5_9HYPH|nr:alpha/beta fold hydrolase BchO [Pararhizobium mangrovi]TPW29606.1 alpha/beta fold hydrolase [Pararhizobium mangrovi]